MSLVARFGKLFKLSTSCIIFQKTLYQTKLLKYSIRLPSPLAQLLQENLSPKLFYEIKFHINVVKCLASSQKHLASKYILHGPLQNGHLLL